MNEAAMAERIVVMNKGEVAMDGTPREVFARVDELRRLSLSVPQVTELLYDLGLPEALHATEAADIIEEEYKKKCL